MGIASFAGKAVGKALGKLSQRSLEKSARIVHDPRIDGWRPAVPPLEHKELVRQGIQELPHDKGVCAEYLQDLINGAMNKYQMQTIRTYLKSSAANNLDAHTRAQLWIACAQRMHYLTTLFDFMN